MLLNQLAKPAPKDSNTLATGLCARVQPGKDRRTADGRLLRDIVYEHAGLVYDESAMMLFDRRLGERLDALGLPNYQAYYKYLRFDARNHQSPISKTRLAWLLSHRRKATRFQPS